MAAPAHKSNQGEICPDPSVHDHSAKLQDQASKAALYVTHPTEKVVSTREIDALGPDGKLSSAGAAASLKYAKAQDLPSFPIVGIDTSSSGNTAANLANANQKPFEHWKPELSSSASKAALLAHKDGGKLNLWQPTASSTGLGAAGLAMRNKHSVELDYGYTEEGHKRALLAATKSINQKRDAPLPAPETPRYPDAANSAANALNAATVAHKPSSQAAKPEEYKFSDAGLEAARIKHLHNVPSEMFTSHPPLQIEAEEKRRQDALRAATLTSKKQIEDAQRIVVEQRQTNDDIRAQAKTYINLQQSAQKLASERLARLDPDGVAAYKEHYGYQDTPKGKLSIKRRPSRKSQSGDNDDDEDDTVRAGRIRNQMRQFDDQVASVDAKKRQDDRQNLRLAAEKAVHARMAAMDAKVFNETGKASPAMMEEWEKQARAKAMANVDERMKHYGKVHIGGGKYMDESEINAIAANRMQPTLDEIADSAEKQRARDEEIRLDQEHRRAQQALEKQRGRDTKEEAKRQKEEEKAAAKEAKETAKAQKRLEKEEEKQTRERRKTQDKGWLEEQQHLEEERRAKAERTEAATTTAAATTATPEDTATTVEPVSTTAGSATVPVEKETEEGPKVGKKPKNQEEQAIEATRSPATDAALSKNATEDPPGVPTTFDTPNASRASAVETPEPKASVEEPTISTGSGSKRDSRLKGFFGKFKRHSRQQDSIGSADSARTLSAASGPAVKTETKAETPETAAATTTNTTAATTAVPVAATTETKGKEKTARSPSPSLDSDDNDVVGAESTPVTNEKPANFKQRISGMRGKKDSGSEDEFQEARDRFDEEKQQQQQQQDDGGLAVPRQSADGSRTSPNRASGSKFQEDLFERF